LQFVSNTGDINSAAWYLPPPENLPASPNNDIVSPDNYQLDRICATVEVKDLSNKRREQNRNSQIAHRQRNKKLIEDLRQELTEYSEYSQHMYQTLQNLRQTTQALVSTIDQALSIQPPKRTEILKDRQVYRSSDSRQVIV
jgi:hypothetical protein